ncbi:MAG TPA: 3-oxoacyl-[acyl-carrier-protein] reductase [Nitrososphaerales archaeon]|nr:3-oxoacyl-[acyl-carrier-protein] reductase [Nitrososphaerales archaeon]
MSSSSSAGPTSFPADLQGKVSLVTGASRGIGAAIAISLANAGSDVVINYRSEQNAADEVVNVIRNAGRNAQRCKFDVTNAMEVTREIDRVATELGRIDILVNNAGINRDKTFLNMSGEDWEQVISTNLTGVFNVTKAALPHMLSRGWGRVVNISSAIGIMGNIGQSNYAASKAGILGFSRSIAKELASKGITVNVIAPGFTSTRMVNSLSQAVKDNLITRIPLKRFATPREVGELVAFVCSPRADYITGEVFSISGGLFF